jgi:hypothetical protein
VLRFGAAHSSRKLIFLLLEVLGKVVESRQGMLEGADERFWVERLLSRKSPRPSRCRYGGVGEVFDEVFDYEVFTLQRLASVVASVVCEHTENLSRVNCGPRIDVLEVWCVRTDDVSKLDTVRTEGSIGNKAGRAGF